MSDLENHFGDDASIDIETNKEILAFLVKNSAETSTMEASWNFLNSINNKDIIAISKTDFWKERHKEIPKNLFKNNQIKSEFYRTRLNLIFIIHTCDVFNRLNAILPHASLQFPSRIPAIPLTP